IRDRNVTGVQTCALPIWTPSHPPLTQPPLGTNSEHPQHQDTPRKMVAPHPHLDLGMRKMRTRRRTHQTRKRRTKSSPPLDHPPRRNTMSTETTLNVSFFDVKIGRASC